MKKRVIRALKMAKPVIALQFFSTIKSPKREALTTSNPERACVTFGRRGTTEI
jgi:hypothetical protein